PPPVEQEGLPLLHVQRQDEAHLAVVHRLPVRSQVKIHPLRGSAARGHTWSPLRPWPRLHRAATLVPCVGTRWFVTRWSPQINDEFGRCWRGDYAPCVVLSAIGAANREPKVRPPISACISA